MVNTVNFRIGRLTVKMHWQKKARHKVRDHSTLQKPEIRRVQ